MRLYDHSGRPVFAHVLYQSFSKSKLVSFHLRQILLISTMAEIIVNTVHIYLNRGSCGYMRLLGKVRFEIVVEPCYFLQPFVVVFGLAVVQSIVVNNFVQHVWNYIQFQLLPLCQEKGFNRTLLLEWIAKVGTKKKNHLRHQPVTLFYV